MLGFVPEGGRKLGFAGCRRLRHILRGRPRRAGEEQRADEGGAYPAAQLSGAAHASSSGVVSRPRLVISKPSALRLSRAPPFSASFCVASGCAPDRARHRSSAGVLRAEGAIAPRRL